MHRLILLGLCLLLPALSPGAESARQEFARVTGLVPDEQRGAELFKACAACHGAEGTGQAAGTTPRIAGQHYRVLVRQLVDFRHGRRWDFQMEGVAKSHDVIPRLQDIADVAWYARQLGRDGARGVGDGEHLEAGEKTYAAHCASCHGASGDGDDASGVPRLAGQHAGYLMRQIYDAVDGRRPPLARTHRDRFAPLDFAQVRGLSDYLSRIGWQGESAR